MRIKTSMFIFVALLASSCGGSTEPDRRKLCDALAITAGMVNDSLLAQATGEFAATERAMEKWDQWQAKTVTIEQDGTGRYSGAWQRAFAYKRAGDAFCDAARVGTWELLELARLIDDRDLTAALRPLEDFTCMPSSNAIYGAAKERKTFQNEWERHRSQAEAAIRDGVAACFEKLGGTPPRVRVPAIWVSLE